MATNNCLNLPTGASGAVIQGNGVGSSLTYSTATYPSTASTSGKIIMSDGTNFQSMPRGNDLVFISTQTAAASAALTFTSLTTYKTHLAIFSNLLPATDATNFEMQVSTNNGSTWAASGYKGGFLYSPYNSTTFSNVNATTLNRLTGPCSNTTGTINGFMYMFNTNTSGVNMTGVHKIYYYDTTIVGYAFGNGGWVSTAPINAIRFLMSSGNITSGTVSLYGFNR